MRPIRSFFFLFSGLLFMVACKHETFPPVADFSVSSRVGFTGRLFTFDAGSSMDPDGDPLTLKCRWDFEDDGSWDTEYSTARIVHHAFTTPGTVRIRLEILDQDDLKDTDVDSIKLYEPVPDTSFTDTRDRQQYQAVKLGGKWWMSENLRYGKRIPSSEYQKDNGITEFFAYDNNPQNIPLHGGLYSWDEMMDYQTEKINQGICPDGWRVPTVSDWKSINLAAPLQFVMDFYGPDGFSGFNMQLSGVHNTSMPQPPPTPKFVGLSNDGYYWTSEASATLRNNTWVRRFSIITVFYPKPGELLFGLNFYQWGDWYISDTQSYQKNNPSMSLSCIKDE